MVSFRTTGLSLVSPEGFPSGPADLLDLLAEAGDALAHHLNAHSTPEDWQDSPDMEVVARIADALERTGRKPTPCMLEVVDRAVKARSLKTG